MNALNSFGRVPFAFIVLSGCLAVPVCDYIAGVHAFFYSHNKSKPMSAKRIEKNDGSPEMEEIKSLMYSLTNEDIEDDYQKFSELVKTHHPEGMQLLENLSKSSTESNTTFFFQYPTAFLEFKKYLVEKYNDHKTETAIMMRVLTKSNNMNLP